MNAQKVILKLKKKKAWKLAKGDSLEKWTLRIRRKGMT